MVMVWMHHNYPKPIFALLYVIFIYSWERKIKKLRFVFSSNPIIIQDLWITAKESVETFRSKENHFCFPLKYCNGWGLTVDVMKTNLFVNLYSDILY